MIVNLMEMLHTIRFYFTVINFKINSVYDVELVDLLRLLGVELLNQLSSTKTRVPKATRYLPKIWIL